MNRRTFINCITGVMAGLSLVGKGHWAPWVRPNRLLFPISLAQWSLHRTLYKGELDNLDFAKAARQDFGIEAVEYVNSFFKEKAREAAYLREMKMRAEGEGVQSVLIMCDGEGDLGHPEADKRQQAVENHFKWVEAAQFLGCHAIRVNARSDEALGYEEQQKLAANGLRSLCVFGDDHAIHVLVENHGGLSSNGAWLAGVMQLVDHPRVGTLPDFGNFRIKDETWYDRYMGVNELMPFAKAVSAKSHEFDANGNEVNTDYLRMMKIVLDAGYRGHVGIEYEGNGLSEQDGIRATHRLLVRVRDQLAASYPSN